MTLSLICSLAAVFKAKVGFGAVFWESLLGKKVKDIVTLYCQQ